MAEVVPENKRDGPNGAAAVDGRDGDHEIEQLPNDSQNMAQETADKDEEEETPKQSKLKTFWDKLGLDAGTLIMMFKGSIPPTVAIAFYQADVVSSYFASLGYLVPIISIMSLCILPRAKYLQNLVLNLIGICIGSSISLLGIWSGVQARLHTTPAGSTATYNSSQSAVSGVWLFANIWFVNVLRAKFPALQFPVIMYSIFCNVSFTFSPLLPTMAAGETLIKELLTGFLTAFAIATVVSLVIVPISCRTVVFKELAGYIKGMQGILKLQSAYLQSLESSDMFSNPKESEDQEKEEKKDKREKSKNDKETFEISPQAKALRDAVTGLTTLHGKVHADMAFAKREIAYDKLGPEELDEIFHRFRDILIPLVSMSTISDIFERIAERRGWIETANKELGIKVEPWEIEPDEQAKLEEKRVWNEVMKQLHEPFAMVTEAMSQGLEHVGLLLEIIKPEKEKKKKKSGKGADAAATEEPDVEAKGSDLNPGDVGFGAALEKKARDFYATRGTAIHKWAQEKGISEEQFNTGRSPREGESNPTAAEIQHRRDQQQIYLILFMEYLLYSSATAVGNLIKYAEEKVEDGTMSKKKTIAPGYKRILKWIESIGTEDSTVDTNTPDSMESGQNTVYLGAGFGAKKDPEHLPPTNGWEKTGNMIRKIPHFLASAESAFGFRAACATMSIGIIAYLEKSQIFFIEQRLVWAMIIIAIGMTVTAGQSMFGFFCRIVGTALSMVSSFIIWYIVDQKTPGVIVMLWLFIFIEMYFFFKFPRFIAVWLISIVTQVLIIGYELQVVKIGVKASAANGQPYYPIFELAPYRLACVAAGSFVAFIWTIFPYPITDRSWLRKDLGATMYLLANYYAVVHSTITSKMRQVEGDMDDEDSPGKKLEKARHKIFGKLLLIIPSLRQHSDWQRFELSLGGRFPKEQYDAIIKRVTNIMNYLSLMSYTARTWGDDGSDPKNPARSQWGADLNKLVASVGPTSHSITSILSLLSASVTQGTALPPYLQLPQPYQLSRRLEEMDSGILGIQHIEEPGYAAYAVMQVASSLLIDDLRRLVENVKDLVGEVDFSFKVVNTGSMESTSSEDTEKDKKD